MRNNPLISIVIPVKNGIATIENCIEGIKKQTVYKQCEIIVIDSGSTDGTLQALDNIGVKVISIAPESFNHGATRNFGVSKSRGEFILMTVQDAVATNELWIENLLKHFNNKKVVGVCGKQSVPNHPDKNPHEWSRPISVPKSRVVAVDSEDQFDTFSPLEQKKMCSWDDVNAMYRKTTLIDIPFQPLAYGEDMLWAKMALLNGHSIVYEPNAIVHHYHYQFPKYTFKRNLINYLFVFKCFSYVEDSSGTLKDYAMIIFRNLRWRLHPKWILHNFKIIYNRRKALSTFKEHLKANTLDALEKELSLDIPLGKQNNTK